MGRGVWLCLLLDCRQRADLVERFQLLGWSPLLLPAQVQTRRYAAHTVSCDKRARQTKQGKPNTSCLPAGVCTWQKAHCCRRRPVSAGLQNWWVPCKWRSKHSWHAADLITGQGFSNSGHLAVIRKPCKVSASYRAHLFSLWCWLRLISSRSESKLLWFDVSRCSRDLAGCGRDAATRFAGGIRTSGT